MRVSDPDGIYKIKYRDLYFQKKEITYKSFMNCYMDSDTEYSLYDFRYDYKIYSVNVEDEKSIYKVSLTDDAEEASIFSYDEIQSIRKEKWFSSFRLICEFNDC